MTPSTPLRETSHLRALSGQPGGDLIHYQDGNNLRDAKTKFIVTMFCFPGQPMLVPVSPEELEQRRDRCSPRP